MAVTLEQVEQLRARADVSYEEARDALEQSGGDLLDALILLERRGKAKGGGFYSTRPNREEEAAVTDLVLTKAAREQEADSGLGPKIKELLYAALRLLRHSLANQFEIWRKGERVTSIPILILIILVIAAFWITVPLIVVGLFFGCQYRFSGPDLNREEVDAAMEKTAQIVHDVVNQVKEEIHRREKKDKNL